MISRIPIIAILVGVGTCTIIPIRWTDDYIPEVLVSVNLPNIRNVTGFTLMDLSSPIPFTLSHESFQNERMIVSVKVVGEANDFEFQSSVAITNRLWSLISGLDLSPNSPFANSAGSFIITNNSLVIQPSHVSVYCSDSSGGFHIVDGRVYHQNIWSIRNSHSGRPIFIDTAVNSLTLSEAEYDGFIEEIMEIGTIEVYAVRGQGMVIPDCDVGALDTILPVFQYTITSENGSQYQIELSAKQYLVTPSDERICHIAVEIADDPNFLHIGSIIVRKYSILFDNDSGRIGICESASHIIG